MHEWTERAVESAAKKFEHLSRDVLCRVLRALTRLSKGLWGTWAQNALQNDETYITNHETENQPLF
jgi:hypothetical protein